MGYNIYRIPTLFWRIVMYRRLLLVIFMLASFFPWWSVKGDSTVTFDSLEVYLRPEYDQPSVSVTYRITINPDVTLPTSLGIHLPTSIGELDYITTKELDGTTVNTPYEREIQGDWSLFTITATGLEIEINYHDPNLTINDTSRMYTFELPRDYSITSFRAMVLQPIGSTAMKITPSLGAGIQNNNGTVTYESDLGAIEAGPNFTITVAYSKSNNAYTSSVMKVQPANSLSISTRGRSPGLNHVLILIVIGLAILLLISVCVWYWRPKPLKYPEQSFGKTFFPFHKKSSSANRFGNKAQIDSNYCHQCGNRTQAGDIYCRMCGTKLHTVLHEYERTSHM